MLHHKLIILSLLILASRSYSLELSMDHYISKIIQENSAIQSERHQLESMQFNYQNTGTLQDPFLSYESAPTSVFKLKQQFVNPFKNTTDKKIASLDIEISKTKISAIERTLTATAKKLFYQLYFLDKIIALAQSEEQATDQMYQSSLRLYETGRVSQQDPLDMSMMHTEVSIRLEQLHQEHRSLLAEVSRLANGAEVSLAFPETITINPLMDDVLPLQNRAVLSGNTQIIMASKEFEKSQTAKELYTPSNLFEYELGAGYDATMGTFEWMGGVSLPLWGNKNETALHSEESVALSASSNAQNVTQRVQSEIADLYYKIQSLDHILPLYEKDLIPKAKQAKSLAKTSYEAGKQDLNSWAALEQKYLTKSAEYYRMQAERLSLEADLEEQIGEWR